MTTTEASTDGYIAFRTIRAEGTYTTEDGILIKPTGTANNLRSQGYILLGERTLKYEGFWSSETLFRALDEIRGRIYI